MFNNVRARYILQFIFSHLSDKKKVYIINYNKTLLEKLEIDLEFVKKTSGKYRKSRLKGKGIGKEYSLEDNTLVFEGDYYNGKKNGFGRELYLNGTAKFEGQYKNDRRDGFGKEYNTDNKLIFEGNFVEGLKNGYGKSYDDDKVIFEGEYFGDKRWNGKIYNHKTGMIYDIVKGNGNVIEYYESKK